MLLMEDELDIKIYWAVSEAAVAGTDRLPSGLGPYFEIELMLKLCISYHYQTWELTADLSSTHTLMKYFSEAC